MLYVRLAFIVVTAPQPSCSDTILCRLLVSTAIKWAFGQNHRAYYHNKRKSHFWLNSALCWSIMSQGVSWEYHLHHLISVTRCMSILKFLSNSPLLSWLRALLMDPEIFGKLTCFGWLKASQSYLQLPQNRKSSPNSVTSTYSRLNFKLSWTDWKGSWLIINLLTLLKASRKFSHRLTFMLRHSYRSWGRFQSAECEIYLKTFLWKLSCKTCMKHMDRQEWSRPKATQVMNMFSLPKILEYISAKSNHFSKDRSSQWLAVNTILRCLTNLWLLRIFDSTGKTQWNNTHLNLRFLKEIIFQGIQGLSCQLPHAYWAWMQKYL